MLPIYLMGNIHCFGMCGPLVMMIGRHKWRALYFLGRILSYTLTGWVAGSLGFVIQLFMSAYHLGAWFSILGGLGLMILGLHTLFKFQLPQIPFLDRKFKRLSQSLSYLLLKDQPLPTFMFGFFTVFLPCGQTLIVFSAIAMMGDAYTGALNGFVFALLTSPSLGIAMQMASFLKKYQNLSHQVMGYTACLVAGLAFLRGFAELGFIPHLIFSEKFHLVIY